jgi:hypothetical protein
MLSAAHRSSVRGFQRSSAASSSFVRNSEGIGSELDMAIPSRCLGRYPLECALEKQPPPRDPNRRQDVLPVRNRTADAENFDGFLNGAGLPHEANSLS